MGPCIVDIEDAAARLRPFAVETPLFEWPVLNEKTGGRILAKAEIFQRTGSFKFRGAYNCISRLDRDAYPGGVVACSSGNHAQGVAEAARLLGIKALVVMPRDAPRLKVERTRASAQIVFYDRETEDRNAIAVALCEQTKAAFVPPFDNSEVIAGQGTAGFELARQAKAMGAELDAVLVPTSGGGLLAGVTIAVRDRFAAAEIYSVEPEGFDDYRRSLALGTRQKNTRASGSICDALLIGEPGALTFSLNRHRVAGGLAVSDADVRLAMTYGFRELKLVLEPGGAVALAALISGAFAAKGRTVAIILSGGNIDPGLFTGIISNDV